MSKIADDYRDVFTQSLSVRGREDSAQKRDTEKELERIELEFKNGKMAESEYTQRKSMLIRRLNGLSSTVKL